jgi:hypothetical protein
MIFPPVTRRTLFGAATLLGPLLRPGLAMPSDPLMAAIRITEAADMAYRAAGLVSPSHLVARASHPERPRPLGRVARPSRCSGSCPVCRSHQLACPNTHDPGRGPCPRPVLR